MVTLLYLASVSTSASNNNIVSVVKDVSGRWKVVSGREENSIAIANLTNTQTESGWLHLDISSNESQSDDDQAVAAGLVEGYLTKHLIYGYYKQFIHQGFCSVDPQFCEFIRDKFQQNLDWMRSVWWNKNSEEERSSYWKTVRLFFRQLEGLKIGWLMKAEEEGLGIPSDFDATWFAFFINFYPDIGDLIPQYKQFKKTNQSSIVFTAPSCSVMIKKLEDDIIIGHATWHVYESMSYRLLKRYNLNYHTHAGDLVPGHTVSMSSHAGNIFSLDDFYTLSSGLSTLETTLFVYDQSLLLDQSKAGGGVWEGARVMVSNRLATDGRSWTQIFSRFNSGTYNNQWMVVDYNKLDTDQDQLWVLEQLPGTIVAKDMTSSLTQSGYWASYNRAFYPEVRRLSGAEDKEREFGSWFSYDNTPRAVLLREASDSVQGVESMMRVLRSNSYDTDTRSTAEGCSGPVPSAALSSRSDLQGETVTCVWEQHDYMVGRRAYGGVDAKVTSASKTQSLSFSAVAGPTTSQQPVFSWNKSGFPLPVQLPIESFNFPIIDVIWNDHFGGRTQLEELAYNSSQEITGPLAFLLSVYIYILMI